MKNDLKEEIKSLKPIIKLAMKYKALQVSFFINKNMFNRVKKYFEFNGFSTNTNKYGELVINWKHRNLLKNK